MRVIKFIAACLIIGLFAGTTFFSIHRIWVTDVMNAYINGYNESQQQCQPGVHQSEAQNEIRVAEAIRANSP